mmetsp:Transcript_45369/g.72996  ORF Transcript_45369/g.72996 Transcript_45369/m.72996 type:complete len:188 (+) Transcript_45369:153-716(+)
MEMLQDLETMEVKELGAILVPTGGGGLVAGSALAVEASSSSLLSRTKLYAVEPEGYDDHVTSFRNGARTPLEASPPSLCDALQAAAPGRRSFEINRSRLAGALSVTDEEVRMAMKIAFETLALVLEPSGAVSLAALLSEKRREGKQSVGLFDREGNGESSPVAIIASGGNVTMDKFAAVMGCKQQPS